MPRVRLPVNHRTEQAFGPELPRARASPAGAGVPIGRMATRAPGTHPVAVPPPEEQVDEIPARLADNQAMGPLTTTRFEPR